MMRNGKGILLLTATMSLLTFAAFASAATLPVLPGGSIQTALDAAAMGDTVSVAEGVYVEQLHMTTPRVVLIGAGVGLTIVRSPAVLPLSFYTVANNYPVLFIDSVIGVEVRDLTVDGDLRGAANVRFMGVAFWNSDGALRNVRVTKVREEPLGTIGHGVCLYAYNDDGQQRDIVLRDIVIDQFQRAGMTLGGAGLNIDAARIDVTGAGPNNLIAQSGIQVSHSAGGTLSRIDVSDIHYTDPVGTASGMLFYLAENVTLSDFTATRCQNSIYFNDTGGVCERGVITDPYDNAMNIFRTKTPSINGDDDPPPPVHVGLQPAPESYFEQPIGITNSPLLTAGIHDIEFVGPGAASGKWGVSLLPQGEMDITITGCSFSGWSAGVNVLDRGGSLNLAVHGNSFTGCGHSLASNMGEPLDASRNWHGTADPALVAAAVAPLADYTPWLETGVDTDAAIGFQGDFSALRIDDDSPQFDGSPRLREAIALGGGGVVHVEPGAYVETVPLTIAADVEILGDPADRPVFTPASGTGLGGWDGAWLRAPAGVAVVMRDLILDGSGFPVDQAFRGEGGGVIERCDLTGIAYEPAGPAYAGTALSLSGGDWTVVDCVFSGIGRTGISISGPEVLDGLVEGCVYDGKGDGDHLDYGIEIGGGATATVLGNTVAGCRGVSTIDGTVSAGVLVSTLAAPGTVADLQDNILAGNAIGLLTGLDAADASNVVCRDNDFSANSQYGVLNVGVETVDALWNWWGDASGPHHPSLNPLGLGVEVSDNVLFDPWHGLASLTAEPVADGPILCTGSTTIHFTYAPADSTPPLSVYEVHVSVSAELTCSASDVDDAGAFGALGEHVFAASDSGDRSVTVRDSLTAAGVGLEAPARLFSITVHGVSAGSGLVEMPVISMTDAGGGPILAAGLGCVVEVECDSDPARAGLTIHPVEAGPLDCRTTTVLSFRYAPGDSTPALRGYELTVSPSAILQFPPENVQDAGALAAIGETFFRVIDNGDGTLTILDALLGATPGLTEAADLFHIEAMPAANGVGTIEIIDFKLRDLANAPIAALAADAVVEVDCPTGVTPSLGSMLLEQNHPNPFNPRTLIGYSLAGPQRVRLTVHALDGRRVATLVDLVQDAGRHEAVWNGRDDTGRPAGAGVYLYRLTTGTETATRKMILIK